jgi:methyl-accepting chemotaxis protein
VLRWLRQLGLRNALFGVSSLSLLAVLAAIWFYVSNDAHLLGAIHRGDEAGVLEQLKRTLWLAMLVGSVAFAGLLWILSRVVLTRPLEEILVAARRMSEADLTQTVTLGGSDELAVLAGALNRIGQGLRDTLARVRAVSEAVGSVIDQLSRSGVQVSSGAATIQSQVTETSRSMADALGTHQEVSAHVEALQRTAEESSTRISEIARRSEEVAEGVEQMAASVQETTAAIDEMTRSILDVSKAIEELGGSTEETSFSIKQMDVSIGQVETNANETARLSEQVSAEAASGVQSLQKTLAGIDRIRESSELAARVIEGLGRRVGEVVAILDVIDEVAEQTNLLALNAAIIAAQAGEQGKGFAVVADEIKELAERTGVSTREISELIARVQDESRNAVEAVEQGVRHVQEGVELGREAETALKRISASANRSTLMVKAIARATVEQARGSRGVTSAVQRIADTVQSVTQSAQAQARGTARITQSAQHMQAVTTDVQRRSQEQAAGSRLITRGLEAMRERVLQLERAQQEQTRGSSGVLKTLEAIRGVSEEQARTVRQLEEAIARLQEEAEVLRGEVRRFRL